MKTGSLVTFREVVDEGDESTLMVVLEVNGDRVLVEELTMEPIHPTAIFPVSDLVEYDPSVVNNWDYEYNPDLVLGQPGVTADEPDFSGYDFNSSKINSNK